MPELPEVETMRRGIAPVVGGKIAGVERAKCKCRPIAILPSLQAMKKRGTGRKIVATERVGKRVIVRLDGGDRIVFEPRMAGLVLIADPPTKEHLRLRIKLTGAKAKELLYWDRRGLGSVRIVSEDEFAKLYGEPKIGPDALTISVKDFRARFASRNKPIKPTLLDQRLLAGVGNLYASEMLHAAKIHPETLCCDVPSRDWPRLHRAMIAILQTAIRYEGSTLGDGTYRNALNRDGSYQNKHRVYARANKPCVQCRGGTIVRIVQAQRSTFFCPNCQKAP